MGAGRAAASVAPLLSSWAPALRASLLGTSALRPRSLPRLGLGPPGPRGSPPEVSAPRARPAAPQPASPLRPRSARRLGLGGTGCASRCRRCRGLCLPLPGGPGGSALSGSRSRAPSFSASLGASPRRGPALRGRASELGRTGPAASRASPRPRPPCWAPPSLQVFPQCLCPPSAFLPPGFLSPLRVSGCLSSTAVSLAPRLLLRFSPGPLPLGVSDLSLSLSFSTSLSLCLVSPRVFSARHPCVSVSLGFSLSLSPQGARSVRRRRSVSLALALAVCLSPPDSVSVSFVPVRSAEHSRPHSGRARRCLPRGRDHLVFSESGFCSQTNESRPERTEPRVPERARRKPRRGSPRAGAGGAPSGNPSRSRGTGPVRAEARAAAAASQDGLLGALEWAASPRAR